MKLITEVYQDLQYLTEKKEAGGKNIFIEGIFMQADRANKNGRLYPKGIMEKEVGRYQDLIKEKRSLGELGHPPNPTINLNQVSHLITDLRMEGSDVIGKAKILGTPMGKIAESLLNSGVCLGVSSRGIGSLRENSRGYKEVGEDFMLATAADIVADPSAPDAFVQGIMEGKEWVWDGGLLREKLAENTRRKINTLVDQRRLEEHKLNLFNEFLNSL